MLQHKIAKQKLPYFLIIKVVPWEIETLNYDYFLTFSHEFYNSMRCVES